MKKHGERSEANVIRAEILTGLHACVCDLDKVHCLEHRGECYVHDPGCEWIAAMKQIRVLENGN